MTRHVFMLLVVLAAIIGCTTVEQAQEGRHPPQEVLGTMLIGFAPTALASLPEPPIDLMLHIRPSAGGREVIYNIADGRAVWDVVTTAAGAKVGASFQNFRLMLSPGEYLVTGVDVRAKGLSVAPLFLPTGGQSFSVPDGSCVYIGRMGAFYLRLPPGPLAQAKAAVGSMSTAVGGKPLFMVYLTTGALVAESGVVDQPQEDEHTPAGIYSKQLLAYAQERTCAVQLARHQAPHSTDGDKHKEQSAGSSDQQLLMLIEQGKHFEALALLDRGADPNAADPFGRTALMYAGLNGQTDTMEVLVARGAHINSKDRSGNTPLHSAIMFGDPEAVRLLIDKGADLNARFDLGTELKDLTPLKLAKLRQRQSPEKRTSDVLARGRLIYHAIKSDYERIVQMLELAGATE